MLPDRFKIVRCLHFDKDCTNLSDAVVGSEQSLRDSSLSGDSSSDDLMDWAREDPASPSWVCDKFIIVRFLNVDRKLINSIECP